MSEARRTHHRFTQARTFDDAGPEILHEHIRAARGSSSSAAPRRSFRSSAGKRLFTVVVEKAAEKSPRRLPAHCT
ncbi:MAG: hypothetical protein IPM80_17985 [Proteobacteria bacterium]|nr:hypothetical protein [Pseudomonadota bacterium]